MTDPIAERPCKVAAHDQVHRFAYARNALTMMRTMTATDMIAELREDNKTLAASLRGHDIRDEHRDIATASLIEVWIDETESAPGSRSRPAGEIPMDTEPRIGGRPSIANQDELQTDPLCCSQNRRY